MSEPIRLSPWAKAVLALLTVAALLYLLRGSLTPIFFAFFIAYLLDPLVDRLEAMKIARPIASILVLLGVLLLVGLFLSLTVPSVISEMNRFLAEVPQRIRALYGELAPWLADHGLKLPRSIDDAVSNLRLDLGDIAHRAAQPLGWFAGQVLGQTASLLSGTIAVLLVPILTFYALNDFDRVTAKVAALVPPRHRSLVGSVTQEVHLAVSQFVRGQLTVMIILGTLYAVGYSLIGIRLAFLIGALAALFSAIPYLGGATALTLALLICALDFDGWTKFVLVGVVYGGIQVVDSAFITPKILGDRVGLSALWVLMAVLIFGDLFGFLGVLLAVPTTAVIRILLRRAIRRYRASEWFQQPADQ